MNLVVDHTSERSVTGLAEGSSVRTVDGASEGEETVTGVRGDITFVAHRIVGDTTTGLTIPLTSGTPPYPTAGTVVRRMVVSLTRNGGTPTTSDRREVITYDGSATAKIQITHDGVTRNCTISLPHGRPRCD
jgi:hypothetical protein